MKFELFFYITLFALNFYMVLITNLLPFNFYVVLFPSPVGKFQNNKINIKIKVKIRIVLQKHFQ